MGELPHGLVAPCQLRESQEGFVEAISLVATGRDSIQTVMSLAFHLTAVALTLTDRRARYHRWSAAMRSREMASGERTRVMIVDGHSIMRSVCSKSWTSLGGGW